MLHTFVSSIVLKTEQRKTQDRKGGSWLLRRNGKKRNTASQQFLLKIYSVHLHEKYHLVSLIFRRFVSHLGGCFDSSHFLSSLLTFSIFYLMFRSTLPAFYLCSLFSLSCFYVLIGMCLEFVHYSFFSVTMLSGIWYAEQFRVRNYASHITINWRCRKSARRCVSNSAIYIELCRVKNVDINHKLTDQFPSF